MRIKDFNLGLLRQPDYDILKHGELDSDSESDDDIDADTNNDDECSSEDLPSQSLTVVLFDPDGIGSDDDREAVLLACKTCSPSLKQGKIPRPSLTNPVPSELQELTVIEEAIIARCRAKMLDHSAEAGRQLFHSNNTA
jgi:hypothetical protein